MNIKEYVIINKTTILKSLEELKEAQSLSEKGTVAEGILLGSIIQLKQILSQSTPLIPVLEQTYSKSETNYVKSREYNESFIARQELKEEYISNLKLDI